MKHRHHWHGGRDSRATAPEAQWACGRKRSKFKYKWILWRRCCGCQEKRYYKGILKKMRWILTNDD